MSLKKWSVSSSTTSKNGLKTTVSIKTEDESIVKKLLGMAPGTQAAAGAGSSTKDNKNSSKSKEPLLIGSTGKRSSSKIRSPKINPSASKKTIVLPSLKAPVVKLPGATIAVKSPETYYKHTKPFFVKRLNQLYSELKTLLKIDEGLETKLSLISKSVLSKSINPKIKRVPIYRDDPFTYFFNLDELPSLEKNLLLRKPTFKKALGEHEKITNKIKEKRRIIDAGVRQFEKYCGRKEMEQYVNNVKWD